MATGKSKDSVEAGFTSADTQGALGLAPQISSEPESDESLVQKSLAGNADAFDVLVLRYQDRVFHILMGICSSAQEAEDLAQEAFLKAFRALNSFRQGSRFYTWLFRIAVNTGLSGRRQVTRRKFREGGRLDGPDEDERRIEQVPARDDADPAQMMQREATIERVRSALDEIEPDYRTILVLRDMDGLDYDQIAETLSISRAAVKSRLHRARIEMARILKDLR